MVLLNISFLSFFFGHTFTNFVKDFLSNIDKPIPNPNPICFLGLGTVKLGDKERFDKEQIGFKELFTDYQPFYTINLLLHEELLPIKKMTKLVLVNRRL